MYCLTYLQILQQMLAVAVGLIRRSFSNDDEAGKKNFT